MSKSELPFSNETTSNTGLPSSGFAAVEEPAAASMASLEPDSWVPPAIRPFSWFPELADPNLTAVDLCCGLGGIGIGLRSLGFRIAKAYDSWDQAVHVYNHNAPEPVAVQCDLLQAAARKKVVSECRDLGQIELLAAGPPCKGFSQLVNGKHDMPNPHNRVLEVIPEYVALLKPKRVLIENVPQLLRHARGQTFITLLNRLQTPGPRRLRYHVSFQVYDASLYGTPQARKRVFIFATRDGTERLPATGPDLASLYAAIRHNGTVPRCLHRYLDILRDEWDARMVSVHQALSDIPVLEPGAGEILRPYISTPKSAFQRMMRHESPEMICNTKTPAVRLETLSRLLHIPPGGCVRHIPEEHLNGLARRFGSAYRKLHPDAPATTLSTKYDCVYHYASNRSLSLREYARIQGIPDFVTFPEDIVSRRSAYEMIGNSVPPLLVRTVLSQTLSCLA